MRYAAKKDDNHDRIAAAFLGVGALVWHTFQAPGLLDMLVGFRGRLYWFEVKDGSKPASKRQLTESERQIIELARAFDLPVYAIENERQGLRIIGAIE